MRQQRTRGITAIELLVGITILAVLAAIILPSLSRFRNHQVLVNAAEDVASLINQARAQTLSSQESTYYSVHFEASKAVLFTGGTYSSTDATNKVVTLDSHMTIPSSGIVLTGGSVNMNFNRLSGDTDDYGTIRIQLATDATAYKTITVTHTGIVSVE